MVKKKILVVDDDEAVRGSMSEALKAGGFEVITAKDGKEGFAMAINSLPALIVVDVEMPEMNGMEMLKELRKSGDWGKQVPVIILTNFDTSEDTLQGIVEDEPAYYLIKSKTNPGMIIEKIKEKLQSGS